MSRPATERAGRIADGWITSSRADLSKISEAVAVIREAAQAAGRDPDAVRIVCRGVVQAGDEERGPDGGRRLLSGSFALIREDTAWLGEQGVTELFYDLNWDPQVGSPLVEPQAAAARAEEILGQLAPVSLGSETRDSLCSNVVKPGFHAVARAVSSWELSFSRVPPSGLRGGRWRRPRYGWRRRACRGCSTRARWRSSAR
jgi:hypothetical protein